MLLNVSSIGKRFNSHVIFSGISFTVDEGHKIALVGCNGSGKSTILKIIAQIIEEDNGSVVVSAGRSVNYLSQDVEEEDLDKTGNEYIQDGIDTQPHKFLPIIQGLGIEDKQMERKMRDLSGGQQTKVMLTKFLLKDTDILLLDEPTNNLDIPSLLWLEEFLKNSKKSMIIVSHDLIFLNNVTNRVIELKDGSINTSRGTYGEYIERKKKEFIRQKKEYSAYIEKIRRFKTTRDIFKKKGEEIDKTEVDDKDKIAAGARRDKASGGQKQVHSINKKIQRLGKIEKPFEEDPFELNINMKNTDGDIEIDIKDAHFGYTDGINIGPLDLRLKLGDRVCFLGSNGNGKSTLLKTLIGEIKPLSGEIIQTEGITIGDLLQHHERAERDKKAIDFFINETNSNFEEGIHALKKAGLSEETLNQKISGLSSGTRARLLFAVFVSLGVNVLVLDEPTNHLDIEAISALKDLLKNYKGIVLIVSHNRWFLKDLDISSCYVIKNNEIKRIKDFNEFVNMSRERAQKMINRLKKTLSMLH